ncbi:hypothetical protein ACFQO1_01060 [Jejudonia soesokkakensis]|uniref:Uncharacterized protein n=1 Tax=Jejudonia soesokkakensis TaxID=1323432 RepID=A0ABW2MR04_9FLAO
MKNFVLLLALFTSITLFAQTEKVAETPQIAIKIPFGETAIVEGYKITFIEVIEDSRCPEGVNCVWAGRVHIKISYLNNKGAETFQEIIIGQVKGDEQNNSIITINPTLQFEVLNVTPYPQYNENKKSLPYALLLKKILPNE